MSSYKSHRARFLIVLTLTVSCAASVSAAFFVVSPPRTRLPTLQTYPQGAASWWKWAVGQPIAVNPIKDTTGEHCAKGQPAFGVWYLAGSDSTEPVRRSCTVPKFRTLLFPVLNVIAPWIPDNPQDIAGPADLDALRTSARRITDASDLKLTIDGVEVRNIQRFYEESTLITVTLPNNNIFGVEGGKSIDPGVDAGYYVAVSGLLPGKHTLAWSGHSDALLFSQDITYAITISGF
jgi:hypothetical protein